MSVQPLNFVFIVADQHNAKILGHQGHPDVKTPALDRMAAEGTRFDRCLTQNPICTPSRVSFLSGQYCHNHGYYGLSGPNPGGLPNLFGYFRNRGYATAALGKIHCPERWIEDDCDVFHETCACSVDGRSWAYQKFLAERGQTEWDDYSRFPEIDANTSGSMEGRPSRLSFEESQDGWLSDQAIVFMKSSSEQKKPFIVHASFHRPHQCTSPSQEFWDLYEGVDLTLPPNADHDMVDKAPHLRSTVEKWRQGDWTLFEPKTFEAGRLRKLRGYLGAVSQVDHAVGNILNYLRDNDLQKNTVVVYCSDHGDYATEFGVMEKAPGICSDAITRVPFIWWGADCITPGQVRDELVELIDVSQTFSTLADAGKMATSDGKDLSALLAGGGESVREVAVTEFAWSKSIRKGDYRLVFYPQEMFAEEHPDGFGELYNLAEDPYEMTNLFFVPEYADKVQELRNDLLEWLITTTRPVSVLNANSHKLLPPNRQEIKRYGVTVNHDGKMNVDRIREATSKNYV